MRANTGTRYLIEEGCLSASVAGAALALVAAAEVALEVAVVVDADEVDFEPDLAFVVEAVEVDVVECWTVVELVFLVVGASSSPLSVSKGCRTEYGGATSRGVSRVSRALASTKSFDPTWIIARISGMPNFGCIHLIVRSGVVLSRARRRR